MKNRTLRKDQVGILFEEFNYCTTKKGMLFILVTRYSHVLEHDRNQSTIEEERSSYHLPSVMLAPMLIPKPTLCNKSFILQIDNTTFVGHPILLSSKEESEEEKRKESEEKKSVNEE